MRPITASAISRAGLERGAPPCEPCSFLIIFTTFSAVNPRISINSRTTPSPPVSVHGVIVSPMGLRTLLMRPRCNSKMGNGLGAQELVKGLAAPDNTHTCSTQPLLVSSDAIRAKHSQVRGRLGQGSSGFCDKCRLRHGHDFLGCRVQQPHHLAHKSLPPCPHTPRGHHLGAHMRGLELSLSLERKKK